MSNEVNLPPNEDNGLYKGFLHSEGGIKTIVDGGQVVEIEKDEYYLCPQVLESDKIYSFKDYTNRQILDEIFRDSNCIFEQGKAEQNSFIICRIVVLDKKKRTISGTAKFVINELQSEKSCNVTSDAKEDYGQKEKGGTLTDKEAAIVRLDILKRMSRKKPSKELATKIRKLASDIRKGDYTSGIVKEEKSEDYVPDLIATHNLDYGNLLFADKLGGISMPSVAIVRIDNPLMNFGDITLVTPKSFVDPESNSSARVFNRDIYSPTYPRVYSHVDKSALNKLESGFYAKKRDWSIYADEATRYDMSKFIEDISNGKSLPDILENVNTNSFIIYLWAKQNGIEIEVPTERYNFHYWHFNPDTDSEFITILQEKYPMLWGAIIKDVYDYQNEELHKQLADALRENYLKYKVENQSDEKVKKLYLELLEDYFEENGLLKHIHDYSAFKNLVLAVTDKRRVDSSAWRDATEKIGEENAHSIREFTKAMIDKVIWGNYFFRTKTSKMEVNLDNIFDYMISKSIKSGEKTLVYGLGNAAALSAKEYESLKAIARDKDHYTVTKEDFEEYKKKQDELWSQVTDKIRPYYKYENGFDALDSLSKAMGQVSKFKNPTDDKISMILSKNDYGKAPSYLYDVIRDFAECLRTAPAQYFEVKMTSVVKLESFIGAAIPKELEGDVVPILNKHGITNIVVYDKSDYENRQSNLSDALKQVVKNSTETILFENGGCACVHTNQ